MKIRKQPGMCFSSRYSSFLIPLSALAFFFAVCFSKFLFISPLPLPSLLRPLLVVVVVVVVDVVDPPLSRSVRNLDESKGATRARGYPTSFP